MSNLTPNLYIGTSGFSYSHWEEGVFYPKDLAKKEQLEFYSKSFDTVELNSPFYHLPKKNTFKNWNKRVPSGFLFAVKVSRFISHRKYLKDCEEPWQNFYERARFLGKKLGPFLVQLPPRWTKNLDRVKNFVKVIKKFSPKERFSFEFRHKSWFDKEVYSFFKKQKNITLCQADCARWPTTEEVTGNFVYIRFHGPEKLYGSNYSKKQLKKWAKKIKSYLDNGLDVYCYFNNDFRGYAVKNAKTLNLFLEQKSL